MNVYLLIIKNNGIITDVKAFTEFTIAISILKIENEFNDEAILYNIDVQELDDKARELKKCVKI